MKAPDPVVDAPRSILILKPSSFGDIIHTLPAVDRLRRRWPAARISWLVNPEWSPLLAGGQVVDEVVIFPRKEFRGWRGPFKFHAWLQAQIRARQPDLALDFQGLLRTAIIGRASRARRFTGLSDAREGARWFYDESVRIPAGVPHAVQRYLALSDRVIANIDPASTPTTLAAEPVQFPLPAGEPLAADVLIESAYVLLHPFARGAEKSLSFSHVQTICACLAPRQVILVGQSSRAELDLPENVLNLLNRTSLPQLIWLTRRAGFVISVDSGPAHLAAALRRPLVAIHTWSDPRRVGPFDPAAWVAVHGQVLRVRDLAGKRDEFFRRSDDTQLSATQLQTICRLATSP